MTGHVRHGRHPTEKQDERYTSANVWCGTLEVVLIIPDNEANTALTTLRELGVAVGALERADVYRCEIERYALERFVAAFRSIETFFNPNKHALDVRETDRPRAGEVWIGENTANASTERGAGGIRIAGRVLPGVLRLERLTGWRLFGEDGVPAPPAIVAAATETLLCNPAFQKATMA